MNKLKMQNVIWLWLAALLISISKPTLGQDAGIPNDIVLTIGSSLIPNRYYYIDGVLQDVNVELPSRAKDWTVEGKLAYASAMVEAAGFAPMAFLARVALRINDDYPAILTDNKINETLGKYFDTAISTDFFGIEVGKRRPDRVPSGFDKMVYTLGAHAAGIPSPEVIFSKCCGIRGLEYYLISIRADNFEEAFFSAIKRGKEPPTERERLAEAMTISREHCPACYSGMVESLKNDPEGRAIIAESERGKRWEFGQRPPPVRPPIRRERPIVR